LLALFFDPEDGGDVPPKRRLTFDGLYGVISQKIFLFRLENRDERKGILRRSTQITYKEQG
jgi:hypothetical protein